MLWINMLYFCWDIGLSPVILWNAKVSYYELMVLWHFSSWIRFNFVFFFFLCNFPLLSHYWYYFPHIYPSWDGEYYFCTSSSNWKVVEVIWENYIFGSLWVTCITRFGLLVFLWFLPIRARGIVFAIYIYFFSMICFS